MKTIITKKCLSKKELKLNVGNFSTLFSFYSNLLSNIVPENLLKLFVVIYSL